MALTPAFIEIDRIKEFSVANENLDNKLLEPTLIYIQDGYLRQLLGKDFYDAIIVQINADTVTAVNQTLLNDYIEPYLINKVLANCMLDITYKLRNKAVSTMNADFTNVADLTDLSKMSGQYEQRAKTYQSMMVEFLCDNSGDYPLYSPKQATRTNNTSGLFLGNVRKKRTYEEPYKDCEC